jgi:hypothetical protein
LAILYYSPLVWAAASVSLLAYAHVATAVLTGSSIITYAVPPWATGLQIGVIALTAWRERRRYCAAPVTNGLASRTTL